MPKSRLTPESKAEISRLREEEGWTVRQIARRLRVTKGVVAWYCLVEGIEKAGGAVGRSRLKPGQTYLRGTQTVRCFTVAEDAMIERLALAGMNNCAIGRAMTPPRAPTTVRGRLATLARAAERRQTPRAASLPKGGLSIGSSPAPRENQIR